jgi:hypothetical protein
MPTQNRKTAQKIGLNRETLRVLSAGDLSKIGGGFLMQDSVIVATGRRIVVDDPTIVLPADQR